MSRTFIFCEGKMTPSNAKLSKNWLYTLMVVVLFIGSACSLVSPKRTFANSVTATPTSLPVASTPTSMPVMIATQPPSVLPTNTQQAPVAQLPAATQMAMPPAMTQSAPQSPGTAKVLLDDNFSSQDISTKNGWTFGTSDSFDQQWMQGMQSFNLKSANNIFWDYLPQTYQDVAVTIDVQPATTGYVEVGIIFAIVPGTTKNEYLFSVDNQGEYYLQKQTNDQWAPVTPTDQAPIPTTTSPFLNTGQGRNQLGVIYLGGTIYLYANGHFLNSYKDPNPITTAGNAGLNFQTDKDIPVTVNLYRYTVYDAQSALNAWGTQPSSSNGTQATSSPNSPQILLDDNFSSQDASTKNGWSFNTSTTFDTIFQNGMQVFNMKSANGIFWDYLPQDYSDVAVAIDVQPTTKGYVEYGIILRVNPSTNKNEYLFSVNNQGQYYLQKLVNNVWAPVTPTNQMPVPVTKSSVLNTGQGRNQLAAIILSNMIYLYANGHYLTSYMAPSPINEAGKVGVDFQTDTDIPEMVNLFRFTIYDAKSALAAWGTNP
jgi:hypothetical protein